jgi:hypothetical protein
MWFPGSFWGLPVSEFVIGAALTPVPYDFLITRSVKVCVGVHPGYAKRGFSHRKQ